MNEKHYIPGIYNYCDNWCQRCAFTSRCRSYARQHAAGSPDPDNFVEAVSDQFDQVKDMLQQTASRLGISLDVEGPEAAEHVADHLEQRRQLRQHPLAVYTLLYANQARAWLRSQDADEAAREWTRKLELGLLTEEQVQAEMDELREPLEVIAWYMHFLHVKTCRALASRASDTGWSAANGYPSDADGSAKVALIACERSIAAWNAVLLLKPEAEDEILDLLALLQQLSRDIANEFPGYAAFRRPGFDDEAAGDNL
ncbi:MAG TPA: hypothetical protein PKE63_04820 [Lacibacter sp.]|nr:hypothetical protein [Lacibacter sp.]HMO88300.1 hypothetical protein [Lacibacter sp.]HMP86576.1 hypothetical protein [Lacibacter sp.]